MKKLSLILASLLLCTAVAMSGCSTSKKDSEKGSDDVTNVQNEKNEDKKDDGKTNSENNDYDIFSNEDVAKFLSDNSSTSIKADALLAYNTSLENDLATYQSKEELDNETLATINGLPISAASVRYANIAAYASYDETVSEEEKKEAVEDFYRINAALVTLCAENGIEFTEDEYKQNVQAYILAMQSSYGEEYDSVFADSPFSKYFFYLYSTIYQPLFSKLNDIYLENDSSDFVSASRSATLEYMNENDYVRAKHILIQFPDGENEDGTLTDAQKEEVLAKANEVLDKVNAMSDISEFDALIEQYNEDPGMESNPDGYYFTKGEMVEEFENAAYGLEEGKTSGLVETSYGYHILLKLPLDDDAIENSDLFTNVSSTVLNELLLEVGKKYDIDYADNYDERVDAFIEEYKAMTADSEE